MCHVLSCANKDIIIMYTTPIGQCTQPSLGNIHNSLGNVYN